MSDWRQIQARIRKARTSSDPSGQLSALYERTRDAMVAFELAQVHEKSGTLDEAARWYSAAAERFRRPQWKQKAEEALTRLGAPLPAQPSNEIAESSADAMRESKIVPLRPVIAEFSDEQPTENRAEASDGQEESVFEQPQSEPQSESSAAAPEAPQDRKRRRRGRRGGRGRNKAARLGSAPVAQAATPATAPSPVVVPPSMFDRVAQAHGVSAMRPAASAEFAESRSHAAEVSRGVEPAAAVSSFGGRVRSGDPALSSRMAQLESQLRRLLACSMQSLEQADEAPAGPGVFLITDSDQTTYYYVEACQTLRVGIGNLLRSGRTSREGSDLKSKLAEHLGINETKVGKYLKDHCGVRWLQLDEGAPLLAHFSIAVLRPIAND